MPNGNEYRFVFTRAGYRPAEVLIYPDKTLVVSPADDAGWTPIKNDPRHLVGNLPTRNFETVSGGGEIDVLLHRDESEPAPSTAPASENDTSGK
jgi:hypothetical protein